MNRHVVFAAASMALFTAAPVAAKCSINRTGQVDVIGNAMPVVEHMAKAMQACDGGTLKVNVKVTDKARAETEQAFSAVSPFEVAQVSNGVFVNLHAKGQLQPITDLVAKYKAQYKLEDRMLVTVGSDVYGIAFMANAQHLFYRKDALQKVGVQPPKTYDELLVALPKLKGAGFETPFSAAYKSGWDLATEFTNIYLGAGGAFFKPGSAEPAFNNAQGLKALDIMTKLKGFMSPNALALASADVTTAFQQGQAAIGVLWGTRAAAMDDPKVSKVANQVEFAPAPAVTAGGKPSNAVWWDAFVMPKRMDGDRDAAFLVMMEAVSEQTMKDGMTAAVWLRSGYTPGRYSKAVIDSVTAGAAMWPDQPYFSLAHAALGKAAADVLSGAKPPAQALADAEREYTQTAKERGFIK
jgi:ABC-type glycerol-3-phosphate transport system substrate-binding protein